MRLVVSCSFAALLFAAACGAPSSGDSAGSTQGEALTKKKVNLLYEGTCSFLHTCSSYSKHLPAGEVTWGCEGEQVCSDADNWLAGPSHAYCGKSVTLCAGSTCTTGVVRDVSDAQGWEAGNAVMDALGLDYGLTGTCSGYGGGTVTITVGAAPSSNDNPPVPEPKPAPPDPTPSPSPGGASGCTADGDACSDNGSCCSNFCLSNGTCANTPTPPTSGSPSSSCAAYAETCAQPSDCCSFHCDGSSCTCAAAGAECVVDAECCNGTCAQGACE